MRMLVLGAGLQGSACAYDLLQNPAVTRVWLADIEPSRHSRFLDPLVGDPRLVLLRLDARDRNAVSAAMAEADACLNALPYTFNLEMARLAASVGIHYADLGGNTEIVFQQLALDAQARARGISLIPDCGLAPGLVNVLAADGIAWLDEAESARIYVGGLPQQPRPPLNYHIVYSLQGVVDYYTTPSWVLRDGEPRQVEALSEVEEIDFPAPVGRLEAFHTGGGLSTLPWTYEGRVRTMEYKTLRFPGHAMIMRAIRDLGLLDLTPVRVRDREVVPREVFIAVTEPRLRPAAEARDFVALRVRVEGRRGGAPASRTYEAIDYYDQATGITAMERTTGFSLSITGQMQVQGVITHRGAATPDVAVPAGPYLSELARRGIQIVVTEG